MSRCVIVGGAEIRNYERIREFLKPNDYYIFCDCGLNHQKSLDVTPNLIIGDFDSHAKPEDSHNVITLPRVKDDTDTIYAVKEALHRGFGEIMLIGVTGGRPDHTLGNIYALLMLANNHIPAKIVDDYSVMQVICSGESVKISYGCKYFSLLNISGNARGIYIRNAKYDLDDAEITQEFQYGISNEVLGPENDAEVFLREGNLLLIVIP